MSFNSTIKRKHCKEVKCHYCGHKFHILNGEFNRYIRRKLNFYCSLSHVKLGKKQDVFIKISKNIGKVFGKLTIIKILEPKDGKPFVRCICVCGKYKNVRLVSLKRGDTKSCGCIGVHKEIIHGDSKSTLYKVFGSMLQRCSNKKHKAFKNYGGRGITVCDEWRLNYIIFREWALKNGYKKGLDLDRINNNGNYEPCNCRWTTRKVSNNNRRNTVYIEYKGNLKTITDLGVELNIPRRTLASELLDRKWTLEMVLSKHNLSNV